MIKRLLIRLLFRAAPVEPELIVHRGEREISVGPAFLGASSAPPAKLSYDEALRCFGVHQGR